MMRYFYHKFYIDTYIYTYILSLHSQLLTFYETVSHVSRRINLQDSLGVVFGPVVSCLGIAGESQFQRRKMHKNAMASTDH